MIRGEAERSPFYVCRWLYSYPDKSNMAVQTEGNVCVLRF